MNNTEKMCQCMIRARNLSGELTETWSVYQQIRAHLLTEWRVSRWKACIVICYLITASESLPSIRFCECKYVRFDPSRIYFFSHLQELCSQMVRIHCSMLGIVVSYWRLSMKICFSLFCQKYRYLGILDGTVLPSVQTFFFFPVLETQFLYNYIVASKKQLSCAINKGYVIKSCFTSLTRALEMGGKASRQPSFALLLPVAVCKTRLLSWLRTGICLL